MISIILKIRILQAKRALQSAGIIRTLLVIAGSVFVMLMLLKQTVIREYAILISAVQIVLLSFIQVKRKDHRFLKVNFPLYRRLLFTEYYLLSGPLFLILLINRQWTVFGGISLALFFIPYLHYSLRSRYAFAPFQKFIPAACFELKSGIRRVSLLLILIFLAGIIFCMYEAAVPIAIFALGLISMNFYETSEPLNLLLQPELGPKKFLMKKVKTQVTFFLIMSLPLAVLFVLLHHKLWYLISIELLALTIIQIYLVFTKYSFYFPGEKSNGAQIFIAIGVAGLFIPFLFPLLLILLIRFYFKSLSILKKYLDDFNTKS